MVIKLIAPVRNKRDTIGRRNHDMTVNIDARVAMRNSSVCLLFLSPETRRKPV
jgi:hypothetical protein